MRGPAVHPIVIAAGGTGGHFFPAEALAAELIRRGERVALMTDARSGALKSPVFAGLEQAVIRGEGIAGRGALKAVRAGFALAAGAWQARGLLARLDPAAIVGFGGYPSVAPVLGSRLIRRRPAVILHEQNAVLGRANRFLARHAAALALSVEATTRVPESAQTVVTGNPVRPDIAALAAASYVPPAPGEPVRILVLGGSLGARVLSDVVPGALAPFAGRVSVVQQCRAEDLERVRAAYAASGIEAELAPFFSDIPRRLEAAHLVIGRAGASTVAELAASGRPSILVPLPGAIDDHQAANAAALAAAGGAIAMPQPSFTVDALSARLSALLSDPAALAAMAAAARGQGRPDAAARLADLVQALAQGAMHASANTEGGRA
ncbi:MAG: undecaprenyldiphospho-muramoylpentapeptide beta-N-acetylglucosaminyltransferase [Proteobacteria bacterium]|nr:undecaprenyldiphospho-muramoylpentapeptide beta-N-acetylglucosaminyltransferase [Pseudomonadota bacterium]